VIVGVGVIALAVGVGVGALIWSGDDDETVATPRSLRPSSGAQAGGGSGGSTQQGRIQASAGVADEQEQPTLVTSDAQPEVTQSQSGGNSENSYHWHWNIKAGNILLLPDFSCPSSTPYIKTNGTYRTPNRQPDVKAWHIADAVVNASSGVGYGSFNTVKTTNDNDGFQILTGWPKGDFWQNNMWAPAFDDGTADLYVTCTSSSAHDDTAWALPSYGPGAAFTWGYH
jgi:hypothetical protein